MTVVDSFTIKGRGLVATGYLAADAEPQIGPCSITLPDGHLIEGFVSAFEHYAIMRWWNNNCGALLRGMESIPQGSVIRGATK